MGEKRGKTARIMSEKIKQERVVIYIPKEQYQQLRSKLILIGKTVSGWFREKVKELLSNP